MLRRSWLKGLAAAFAGVVADTVGRSSYAGGTPKPVSYKGGSPEPVTAGPFELQSTEFVAEPFVIEPAPALPVEPDVSHHAPSPTLSNRELADRIMSPPGGQAAWPDGKAASDYEAMRGSCPPRHVHHSSSRYLMESNEVLPGGVLSMGVGTRRDPDNIRRMQEAQARYLAALEGFVPPPARNEQYTV